MTDPTTSPMTSPENSPAKALYLLKRDYTASTRLNFQHYVWKQELGFNIHPSITLPPNPHIADVACGTSLWSIEVRHEHPTATIAGMDISLRQAPSQPWLTPINLTLHEWDMTDPNGPPEGLSGTFDLVHIRLVLLALEDNIAPLLSNILQLLKPGGHLQWDEADFGRASVVHPSNPDRPASDQQAPYMTKLLAAMTHRSHRPWLTRLPQNLDESGFGNARRHEYAVHGPLLKFATDLILMVWDEIIDEIPEAMAERKQMLGGLVQGTKLDAANGCVISAPKSVTVAVKKG